MPFSPSSHISLTNLCHKLMRLRLLSPFYRWGSWVWEMMARVPQPRSSADLCPSQPESIISTSQSCGKGRKLNPIRGRGRGYPELTSGNGPFPLHYELVEPRAWKKKHFCLGRSEKWVEENQEEKWNSLKQYLSLSLHIFKNCKQQMTCDIEIMGWIDPGSLSWAQVEPQHVGSPPSPFSPQTTAEVGILVTHFPTPPQCVTCEMRFLSD